MSRSRTALGVGAVALAGALCALPASASASLPGCQSNGGPDPDYASSQDVNGDAVADPVEGVPSAAVHKQQAAGVVDVHDFCALDGLGPQRLSESFFTGLPAAAADDRFGAAVSYRDQPGSAPYGGLVIGAPGANAGRGAVVVAQGSASGIRADGAIRLVGENDGEQFGAAVVADGADIWVGAPDRAVSGHAGAGAIDHYRITGTTATLVETLTEDTPGIPGLAEADDHFGALLAVGGDAAVEDVVVGEPSEDVGGAVDAGTVTTVQYDAHGTRLRAVTISQDSAGISGGVEAGDRFGAAVSVDRSFDSGSAPVAIGVPGEDLGSVRDAGMIHVILVGPTGAVTQVAALSQESATIPGGSEAGDQFGASVLLGDLDGQLFQGDFRLFGAEDVAIGAPGEDIGTVADAGDVILVQLASSLWDQSGLAPRTPTHAVAPALRQGGGGASDIGGAAAPGNRVGAVLYPLAYPDGAPGGDTEFFSGGGARLLVGVPGSDINGALDAGAMAIAYNPDHGYLYDSDGPVAGERYGSVAPTAMPAGRIVENEGD